MNPASRIAELAALISKNTSIIDSYFQKNDLPQPSFAEDGPLLNDAFPPEINSAKVAVLSDTLELRNLLQGPQQILYWNCILHAGFPTEALYRYKIHHHVPLNDPKGISFTSLSAKTGLALPALVRIIRAAITTRIFCEPTLGMVAHSCASHLLATDSMQEAFLGMAAQDAIPAIAFMGRALAQFPECEEPNQTGFSVYESLVAGKKDLKTFYQVMQTDAARAKRFADSMSYFQTGDGYSTRHVVEMFDWGSLPDGGLVVDVGGSHGDIAVAIGSQFPHLKILVEDLKDTIATRPTLQLEKEGRLDFLVHDFFELQPVKGADLYLLRWILHNYTDAYAIKILRSLIPALKNGSRVLIMDAIVPAPGTTPNTLERDIRMMDCAMFALFNSGDRDLEQWKTVIEGVDPRLKFKGVTQRKESTLSFIEAVWED